MSWGVADPDWYNRIHYKNPVRQQRFEDYLKSKTDIESVLEVGCGTGVYPIQHKELFVGMAYTGLDFSPPCIDYCKKHSDFTFMTGDFLEMGLDVTYDMLFSHAVIDHVPDPNKFLAKVVALTKKYAYITAFNGYHPNLRNHGIHWHDVSRVYCNELSIPEMTAVLYECGLKHTEINIHRLDNSPQKTETVIIIERD